MVNRTDVNTNVDEQGVEIILCFETEKEIEESIRRSKLQTVIIIEGEERLELKI